MNKDALVSAIQIAYPQLWFACHVEHRTRSRSGDSGLTDRDIGLLAHVAAAADATATDLAAHIGIGKPALSQHLKRLQRLGLLDVRTDAADRRQRRIALTKAGKAAVAQHSPLDRQRLSQLIALIPPDERTTAVQGLQCLARAAAQLQRRLGEESDS